jgi:hypothetical protein
MSPIAVILIIVLVVVLTGGGWGVRSGYVGAGPFGGMVGFLLIVLLLLWALGVLR